MPSSAAPTLGAGNPDDLRPCLGPRRHEISTPAGSVAGHAAAVSRRGARWWRCSRGRRSRPHRRPDVVPTLRRRRPRHRHPAGRRLDLGERATRRGVSLPRRSRLGCVQTCPLCVPRPFKRRCSAKRSGIQSARRGFESLLRHPGSEPTRSASTTRSRARWSGCLLMIRAITSQCRDRIDGWRFGAGSRTGLPGFA